MGTLAVKRVEYGSGEKCFSQGTNVKVSSKLQVTAETGTPKEAFGLHYTTTRDAIAEYDGKDLENRIYETMLTDVDYVPEEAPFDANKIYNYSTYFYYPVNIHGDTAVLSVANGGKILIGEGGSLGINGGSIELGEGTVTSGNLADGSVVWSKLGDDVKGVIDGKINKAGHRGYLAGYNTAQVYGTSDTLNVYPDSPDDIIAPSKVTALNLYVSTLSDKKAVPSGENISTTKTVFLPQGISHSLTIRANGATFYWVQGSVPNYNADVPSVLILKMFKNGSTGSVIANIMALPNGLKV